MQPKAIRQYIKEKDEKQQTYFWPAAAWKAIAPLTPLIMVDLLMV